LAVGKAHQIEKGHLHFVGEFAGTLFNDKGDGSLFDKAGVKCPGFYDLDFNNKKGRLVGTALSVTPPVTRPPSVLTVKAIPYIARDHFNISGAQGNTRALADRTTRLRQLPRSIGRISTWNR
jgi:hypothetical protein